MSRDEVMALLNQSAGQHWCDEAHIQRFAHLVYESVFRDANIVAAAEREACAKVCESVMPNPVKNWSDAQIVNALRGCAAAIRARSNP